MRSSDWSADVCSSDLVGDIRAKRFVNQGGKRGALRVNADQHARAASLYGEVRVRPVAELTLIAGGIYADGKRRQVMNFNAADPAQNGTVGRSEEHTSELQSLMRISYAVFCLKKQINQKAYTYHNT